MYSRTNTNSLLISNCVFRSTFPAPWVFIKITCFLPERYWITPARPLSLNQTSTLSLSTRAPVEKAKGSVWQPSPRRCTAAASSARTLEQRGNRTSLSDNYNVLYEIYIHYHEACMQTQYLIWKTKLQFRGFTLMNGKGNIPSQKPNQID